MRTNKIQKIIYSYYYDELSDYAKGIRDILNLLTKKEEITQDDIIKQILLSQKQFNY